MKNESPIQVCHVLAHDIVLLMWVCVNLNTNRAAWQTNIAWYERNKPVRPPQHSLIILTPDTMQPIFFKTLDLYRFTDSTQLQNNFITIKKKHLRWRYCKTVWWNCDLWAHHSACEAIAIFLSLSKKAHSTFCQYVTLVRWHAELQSREFLRGKKLSDLLIPPTHFMNWSNAIQEMPMINSRHCQ